MGVDTEYSHAGVPAQASLVAGSRKEVFSGPPFRSDPECRAKKSNGAGRELACGRPVNQIRKGLTTSHLYATPDHSAYEASPMKKGYKGKLSPLKSHPVPSSTRKSFNVPDQPMHEDASLMKLFKGKMKPAKELPAALSGLDVMRKTLEIQTDAYLEEFVEKVSEFDAITQTDSFLDRPPTPLFIPQKAGPDTGTQIEEGDLFNFDDEVEPMIEVLVGRTLEQSVMEVMEEMQLANLHAYQEHFERIRAAELVATQRMESAERRIMEEKKKRIQQEKKRLEEEQRNKAKVETQMYVRDYIRNMLDSIFRTLQKLNFFYDPVEKEVEDVYFPFLMAEMGKEVYNIKLAQSAVKNLVEHICVNSEDRDYARVKAVVNNIISKCE